MTGHDVAVVLGGSIAGMLTARALADTYGRVIIVDRDELDGDVSSKPRRGVPQGRHAHGLLAAGRQAIEELLPGATDELTAAGVPTGDVLGNLRFFTGGHWLRQAETGLVGVAASRPYLESYIRSRVTALPGVTVRAGTDIVDLDTSADRTRVTGVRVQSRTPGSEAELIPARLVVDATGRGSRTPQWLEDLGYERPQEERLAVDLAYVTRQYRMNSQDMRGDLGVIVGPTPGTPRGAFVQVTEGGRSVVTLFGILGDHPPTDDEGFSAFAKSAPRPDVHELISGAEALSEPVLYKFPYSMRRRYERLRRFPAGLLVIGDAVSSFNPLYGQGMSVAALEARALYRQLAGGGSDGGGTEPSWRRYFASVKSVVDTPWQMSTGADLSFPGVEGERTAATRLLNRYVARLQAAASHDAVVARTFTGVSNLVTPPGHLMRPGIALRALRSGGRKQR